MSWGLSLGGGGILGFAHIGVLSVLKEHGFWPDVITGSSAGGAVAGLVASEYDFDLGLLETEILGLFAERQEPVIKPLLSQDPVEAAAVKGIFKGDLLLGVFEKLTEGKSLGESCLPLSIPSVDVETGAIVVFSNVVPPYQTRLSGSYRTRVYVSKAKIAEAVRASVSVPGLLWPFEFKCMNLADGGILDMIPAYEARRMGAKEVIAVDLGLHTLRPQKVGGVVSVLSRSFALASRESVDLHLYEHASLVLQPEVTLTGLPTRANINKLIQAGEECARKNLCRIAAIAGR